MEQLNEKLDIFAQNVDRTSQKIYNIVGDD